MVKSKKKAAKPEVNVAEFVQRLKDNKKSNKRNGLKRRLGRHHR